MVSQFPFAVTRKSSHASGRVQVRELVDYVVNIYDQPDLSIWFVPFTRLHSIPAGDLTW